MLHQTLQLLSCCLSIAQMSLSGLPWLTIYVNLFVVITAANVSVSGKNLWNTFLTAVGGGALRDEVCFGRIPAFLFSPDTILAALLGYCAGLALRGWKSAPDVLDVLDAVGIGTFLAFGMSKCLEMGIDIREPKVLLSALFTALGGGVLSAWATGTIYHKLRNGNLLVFSATMVICAQAFQLPTVWAYLSFGILHVIFAFQSRSK